jgi:nicotinamide riboside kinase
VRFRQNLKTPWVPVTLLAKLAAMQSSFFKICLLGAESTGKSTLAKALALELCRRGYWAQALPEVLRLFCARWGRLPVVVDEPHIFETQQRAEQAAHLAWQTRSRTPGFLFCDSSPLLTAFTSQWYFGDESLLKPGLTHQASYFHTYFTLPTLPWIPDGIQRDGPEVRVRFSHRLEGFLEGCGTRFQRLAIQPEVGLEYPGHAEVLVEQLLAKAGLAGS